ncbi:MAG: NADH:flavin oxidoreductase/NADH oxidase [Chitinophagaceae bacterium]|nr:MAG: NADH:flavin oxidoreductase/NADH oxidase [Chitinophagaceae bacterium]
MSLLFSPVAIADTQLKNRIVISPMCQYSSVDGFANDWHMVHLGCRATGGASLIIQEATAVNAAGRITYGDLGIWKDEHIEKLKQIVSFIHEQGSKAGIQLAHAGRKASCELPWNGGHQIALDLPNSWETVSASAIPFKTTDLPPVALDKKGISTLISDYVAAVKRAKEVGYDVIEIHAAHGYLIHQFYSPFSNNRTDEYGGNFENRVRLLVEVTRAVKSEWGEDKPLFVRISATDWTEGGWTIEDSVHLSKMLKNEGVHLIDTSSGGNVPAAKIPNTPGYQVDFASRIKNEAGILTGAVGLITSAEQAEEIIVNGKADLVLLARESLRNPNFPLTAAHQLGADIKWPIQYERAKPKPSK